MRFFRFALISALIVLCVSASNAQDKRSEGARVIFHPAIDIKADWYGAVWVIGNTRTEIPDNINLFAGIGKRIQGGYVEFMLWKQWAKPGPQWALDFRYQVQPSKDWSLYVEASPLLNKRGFYEFVIVERRLWKRLHLGIETENTHRPGKDSLGVGPRIRWMLYQGKNFQIAIAGTHQIRNDISLSRFYEVNNARFDGGKLW